MKGDILPLPHNAFMVCFLAWIHTFFYGGGYNFYIKRDPLLDNDDDNEVGLKTANFG
jgi:hypothetical protein